MRQTILTAGVLALIAGAGGAGKPKIKPSVTYATTWEAAIEEAKKLNVPIVVHSHGFYWGPCWSVHGSVLQNDKYIEFAEENTVEVIELQRLQEGIDAKDRKAETYKAEDGRELLAEFPNLTVQEMLAFGSTKAGTYNNTGKIPYTAIVNPHDETEIGNLKGGFGMKALMEAVKEAKKTLEAQHGPSVSRKDVRSFEKDAAKIRAEANVSKAVADARALQQKAEKKPETIRAGAAKLVEEQLARAGAQLDEAEKMLAEGAAKEAQKILGPLARALKGTDLEARVNELLEKTKV